MPTGCAMTHKNMGNSTEKENGVTLGKKEDGKTDQEYWAFVPLPTECQRVTPTKVNFSVRKWVVFFEKKKEGGELSPVFRTEAFQQQNES